MTGRVKVQGLGGGTISGPPWREPLKGTDADSKLIAHVTQKKVGAGTAKRLRPSFRASSYYDS
ncbi:hypothetical protein GCM10023172_21610 [Hymenobacter ginsengisoli]|uniref:Uncharacterized protein n=1 Tax=Hymenobacter ginsengisoli TaxID=1051626 RepID=A0ABP8QBV4_9BACT